MDIETDPWVVQINEKLKSHEASSMEIQKWKKHCIYAVPFCVADVNKKAYSPQTVSFGPYHHMKKHLVAMEEHKQRALIHFLRRCGKPLKLLMENVAKVKEDLRECYKPLDHQWENNNDHHSFLKMMIFDGCFMLEVLRFSYCDDHGDDYADNDPIFSCHGRLYFTPYIKRDMLMLENQIPMMVLEKLLEFEGNKNQDPEFLNKLILRFFCPGMPIFKSFGKCFHVLDLYRKFLLQHEPTRPTTIPKQIKSKRHQQQDEIIIPSARELQEAGITFRPSRSHSLKDVSFNNGGTLRIPSIIVDDTTETTLLNLIAFERMHVGAGNEVSSFVFFMDNIIDNEVDVVILEQKGIIQNALGSDKAVAKLFNSLSRDLCVDREGNLDIVQVSVCRYCKKPWNRWRANLIETYFRNPWAIVSLVAAIFLFVLTIIQTVYTIIPMYKDDNSGSSSNSSPPPPIRPFIPRLPPPRL